MYCKAQKQRTYDMSLLTIILAIVLVGLLLYVVNSLIPMEPTIKRILNIVVILALVVWLLKAFGLFSALAGVHV